MFMRREQAVPAELATTTFGPPHKYVAANDNVPKTKVSVKAGNFYLAGSNDEAHPFIVINDEVWRAWSGGGAPVGDNVEVEVLLRNGGRNKRLAHQFDWLHKNQGPFGYEGDDEIVAYRPLSFDNVPVAKQPAPKRDWNAGLPRTGDFMQVFSGRKYWPMDPRPHEVHIEDIAHSLAMQARYAGHCIKFYSVAEHSVLIARHLAAKHAPEVAFAGLLHDAPEAYCVDIPRPLKPYLTNYRAIEQDNWLAIAARFGLPTELPREVHDADNRIIADELVNLRDMPWHARHDKPLGVKLRYWSPEEAELEFLATFDALMAGRAA